MTRESSRRRWLQLCSGGALVALAGCTGNGTPEADGDEQTDDAPAADDDGDAAAADDAPGDEPDDGAAGEQTFGDVYAGEVTSFVMEFEVTSPEAATGRMVRYEDDVYVSWTADGMDVEIYEVDGTHYQVFEGMCYAGEPDLEPEPVETDTEPDDQMLDLPIVDTTTIDGEEAYVFEDGTHTWYLSASTGYPLRVETADAIIDYHSWNDVDPITPPEMECVDPRDV